MYLHYPTIKKQGSASPNPAALVYNCCSNLSLSVIPSDLISAAQACPPNILTPLNFPRT